MPFSPLRLLLFILALVFLVIFVQLGIVAVAFGKLGLSAYSAYVLIMATLVGSPINLPLFRIPSGTSPARILPFAVRRRLGIRGRPFPNQTVIAVNVGGCVIPVAFSIYLLVRGGVGIGAAALAVAVVGVVAHGLSRPVQGVGIGMPVFVPPITAALVAVLLDPAHSAPLAYVGGTLGVLLGADLLRLKDIGQMGAPVASIGGAGTFDGIFLTGIVAVLLA
ncbi:MAG: DUF1614 domain-containing protein [Betaproteobacteria bacterium]|nr:DUF1614 domain-containing protein [Betaproteobacteria bacterium]